MMNQIKLTKEIVHSEIVGDVPVADLHMMTNQEELDVIAECKKEHPEFYTKEFFSMLYEQSEEFDDKLPIGVH